MKGDKLVITEEHVKVAQCIVDIILVQIMGSQKRFIITIAGESGSGKSEIAASLSEVLSRNAIKSIILQQDDYFVYPPKTNAEMRKRDINHVGLSEVRLALLDSNLKNIIEGKDLLDKPLVIFDDDLITQEEVNLEGIKVAIVEGTYTTSLKNVHQRIFIDRTYIDTMEARKLRNREEQDDFLERILEIEHGIISLHKPRADIIVTNNYEVIRVSNNG